MEPSTAREAAERNAEAVRTGNLAQIMADITPGALAQMMSMGAQGGLSPTSMPSITGFEIGDEVQVSDGTRFQVTFESSMGRATLATTWKQVMGQWKITAIELVSAEPAAGG